MNKRDSFIRLAVSGLLALGRRPRQPGARTGKSQQPAHESWRAAMGNRRAFGNKWTSGRVLLVIAVLGALATEAPRVIAAAAGNS